MIRNVPEVLLVTVCKRVVSKLILTVSLVPKPVPLTLIGVVGGPVFTFRVIAVLAAFAPDCTEISTPTLAVNTRTSRSATAIFERKMKRSIQISLSNGYVGATLVVAQFCYLNIYTLQMKGIELIVGRA